MTQLAVRASMARNGTGHSPRWSLAGPDTGLITGPHANRLPLSSFRFGIPRSERPKSVASAESPIRMIKGLPDCGYSKIAQAYMTDPSPRGPRPTQVATNVPDL